MKSRWGGLAGAGALWDSGHGTHPAFLPGEPRGTRGPCPRPAGTCFPLKKHLPNNIYRWSQVTTGGNVLSSWAACTALQALYVLQTSQPLRAQYCQNHRL